MIGFFDENGRPKIKFRIIGTKDAGEITALFDTGFSGSLALPPQYLIAVGSELAGIEPMTYADGRTSTELLFNLTVDLDGTSKSIAAHLIPGASEPIAGNQLFSPYVVLVDFTGKRIDVILKETFDQIIEAQQKQSEIPKG